MLGMQSTLSPSSSPSSPLHSGLLGFHTLQLDHWNHPSISRFVIVSDMTKTIGRTGGNAFVPIERSQKINMYYDYAVSITVFTSILKFCRFGRSKKIECNSSSAGCSASRRRSSRSQPPSSFASSDSPPLSSSLSSSLDPFAGKKMN